MRRRGKEAEEEEGRGQWSGSGCRPPAAPDTQHPSQPFPQLLTPQPQHSHALSCSGPWASSGPSLPSALYSETSAAELLHHHHSQDSTGQRQERRPSFEQPPGPPHTSPR